MISVKNLVPHWLIWGLALVILAGINLIIVTGKTSHTMVEASASCDVVETIPGDHSVVLKLDCRGANHKTIDTIDNGKRVIDILQSPTPKKATCDIYANGDVSNCKPLE